MAEFDFQGLLGNMFGGGGDSELEKLLTAKQREQLGMQSSLAAAAQLLKASGRGPQRIGLGQALGSAFEAGQGAYEKGTTIAFQQMLLKQKLSEGQQELDFNTRMREMLMPKTSGGVAPPVAGAQMPLPPAAIDGPGVQVFAPDAPRATAPAQPSARLPT